VTRKNLRTCAALLLLGIGVGRAQHPIPYAPEHKQPEHLVANAANADEYVKVATYFHYRELEFRARAQNAIHSYATHVGRYPMATKTVTHAAAVERQYSDYLSKAEKNARLAANYDQVLEELGRKPAAIQSLVVSVKDLQQASNETLGN